MKILTAVLRILLGVLLFMLGMIGIISENIGKKTRKFCFGNWTRTGVTLVVSGFVLENYFPGQIMPIFSPLLAIAVALFGIWVMFHPYFLIKAFKSKKGDKS